MTIAALISAVIYLVVVGLIIWLLLYLIDVIPLPEPFHKVARVLVIAFAVIIVIYFLLGLLGQAPAIRLR